MIWYCGRCPSHEQDTHSTDSCLSTYLCLDAESRGCLVAMKKGNTAWLRHRVPRERIWRLVDARGQVLGRMATQIAGVLQGLHKPYYMDNINCGDPVVVINARHFTLTGRKRYNKEYIHHSGYPGGLKRVPISLLMQRRPEAAVRLAVRNMLPPNRLRQEWLDNLKIFMDEEHKYENWKPVPLPPAHMGHRLRTGGPPKLEEMKEWWLTHLSFCPDSILREVLDEVREENPRRTVGLAEIVDFGEDLEPSQAEIDAVRMYLQKATEEDHSGPVVCPAGLS